MPALPPWATKINLSAVKGKDVLMLIRTDDGYEPFVCAQDLSFDSTASMLNVTTKGDGVWDKFKPESLGYTVTMTGVVSFTTGVTSFRVLQHQFEFVEIEYKIVFSDDEDNTKFLLGSVWVESSTLSGDTGSIAKSSFTLRGNGKPELLDCDGSIGEVVVTQVEDGQYSVQLNFIDGAPALYYYTVDSGDEQQTTNNPFTIDGIEAGSHTIIVTPACSEDKRGAEIRQDFYRTPADVPGGTPEDPLLPVTDLLINNIGTVSFHVSWHLPDGATSATMTVTNLANNSNFVLPNITDEEYDVTGLINHTNYQVSIVANYPTGQSASVIANATTQTLVTSATLIVQNTTGTFNITNIIWNGVHLDIPVPIGPHTSKNIEVPLITNASIQISFSTTFLEFVRLSFVAAVGNENITGIVGSGNRTFNNKTVGTTGAIIGLSE